MHVCVMKCLVSINLNKSKFLIQVFNVILVNGTVNLKQRKELCTFAVIIRIIKCKMLLMHRKTNRYCKLYCY